MVKPAMTVHVGCQFIIVKYYLSALFFANAFGSIPYLPFFVQDFAMLRYEHSVLFVITQRRVSEIRISKKSAISGLFHTFWKILPCVN